MSLANVGLRAAQRSLQRQRPCFAAAFLVDSTLAKRRIARQRYSTETSTSNAAGGLPPYVTSRKAPARVEAGIRDSKSPTELLPEKVALPKDQESENPTKAVAETSATGSRWQRIKATVKKEARHYWHGTKLLGKEVRISMGLVSSLLRGRKLTRREHRQLKRTSQDLLRLIPFSVFLIVPFMELLLPVALKLFPNMLPSTFADKHKEDEKKRKLLKVRIEMAKFLQETLRESGVKSPEKIRDSEEFQEFFRKVRATGENPSTDDIVRVAKLFDDDLTLENLSRPQLVSMCRYMNINAFGTDNFLRHTIRARLAHIKNDDKVIEAEGIEALQDAELEKACQSRAIRTQGVTVEKQREHLMQWIDMHLNRGLSGVLLILSRAFTLNTVIVDGQDNSLASLKDTLASLPDSLLNATELSVSSDRDDFAKRLEVLQEQEELIEDEREQEEKEISARAAEKAKEKAERESAEEVERAKSEAEATQAEADLQASSDKKSTTTKPEEDQSDNARMTGEQLNELGAALEILSARSSVLQERADLRQLMEDNSLTECTCGEEDPKQKALQKRVKQMIETIDTQLEEYDKEVGAKLNLIELKDGRLSLEDLKKALNEIRHPPPTEKVDKILDKLDVDHDGFIPMSDIEALAEAEGLGILVEEASAAEEILSSAQKLRKSDLLQPEPHVHTEDCKVADKPSKLKREDVVES